MDHKPLPPPFEEDDVLTKVHPNYAHALRVQTVIATIPAMIAALVTEAALRELGILPPGLVAGTVLLIAGLLVLRIPQSRFNARGYQMGSDRLRVVRGLMFRSDTVVPFGRVQHIDVGQGPLERFFGIATLTLHTAGNHNASVSLPGLGEELAREMREAIRAHIRRETL
jgi:membrane protein YdbS with pleckstrin-like domain